MSAAWRSTHVASATRSRPQNRATVPASRPVGGSGTGRAQDNVNASGARTRTARVSTSTEGVEGAHEASVEASARTATVARGEDVEPMEGVPQFIALSLECGDARLRRRIGRLGLVTARFTIGLDARLDFGLASETASRVDAGDARRDGGGEHGGEDTTEHVSACRPAS